MPEGVGYPAPNLGLVDSSQPGGMAQTSIYQDPNLPNQVSPMHPTGKFNFTAMLPMLQGLFGQQQQGPPPPTAPGLIMPNTNVSQFQVTPLSGLFGLHRGV